MKDKLTAILERIKRNKNKADMHSFTARVKDGVAYVNYAYTYNITIDKYNGDREHYSLNLTETYQLLQSLMIDENTFAI